MCDHRGASWLVVLIFFFVTVAGASGARASGFQIRENSAAGLGTAFAGAASAADDISTIANNPAGMTRLHGSQVGVSASIILPSSVFSGSAATNTGAAVTGGSHEDAGSPALVPAFYGLWDFSPSLKFGLAITSPFGLKTSYESGWVGRYNALDSELETIAINPNVAYRVTDWLSLGAGATAQHTDVRLTNAVLLAPFPDGNAEVKGDAWGYGFNLGALLEPVAGTRIGLTYRSQIFQRITGDATFTLPAGVPGAVAAAFPNSGASAELRTPDIATISLYQDLTPQLAVMADVSWTHWQVFKDLTIRRDDGSLLLSKPEHWTDTVMGSLGAVWRPNDAWTFRTGIAYDVSPVKDEFRTARIPDQDRLWLAVGVGYRLNDAVRLDAGYAHLFVRDASIDAAFPAPLAGPTASGRLSGSYSNGVDLIAISGRLAF